MSRVYPTILLGFYRYTKEVFTHQLLLISFGQFCLDLQHYVSSFKVKSVTHLALHGYA